MVEIKLHSLKNVFSSSQKTAIKDTTRNTQRILSKITDNNIKKHSKRQTIFGKGFDYVKGDLLLGLEKLQSKFDLRIVVNRRIAELLHRLILVDTDFESADTICKTVLILTTSSRIDTT
ncbi:hypothetical protein BpHYR1_032425 [Brachionus plicatilis]|uniref:Uncharacterized protein n=1 Tax=Brachionus plicatilis TaxID=10195 RepID=A0A3M7T2I0_BRAPC|nr:hypothetical protein BpHYR1_032425 [Brachionus plicatilis]